MNLQVYCNLLIAAYHICVYGGDPTDAEIFRYPCRKDATFKLVRRKAKLDAAVIATVMADTLSNCAKRCIDSLLCKTLNYNLNAKKCETLSEHRLTVGESKLIAANFWKHYEPLQRQVIV